MSTILQQRPKVSIVTTSFNAEKFIEQTIQSVLAQTYPNIEYIILDGGSTDQTCKIIQKYQDRLAYWVSEPDKGMYEGINKGFSHATGDIWAYLNSDDQYLPTTIETVVQAFNQYKPDYLYGDTIYVDDQNKPQFTYKSIALSPRITRWLGRPPFAQSSAFWTPQCYQELGGFDLHFQYASDFKFFLTLCMDSSKKGQYVPQPLSLFRCHKGAISSKYKDALHQEGGVIQQSLGIDTDSALARLRRWSIEVWIKMKNLATMFKKIIP